MSHHRFPICPASGKVRYGERKDVKLEMRQVAHARSRARLNDLACSRLEIRSYSCSDCRGWHLTSTPARPVRLLPVVDLPATNLPVVDLSVPSPRTAAQAIQRMVSATGLTVGAAA